MELDNDHGKNRDGENSLQAHNIPNEKQTTSLSVCNQNILSPSPLITIGNNNNKEDKTTPLLSKSIELPLSTFDHIITERNTDENNSSHKKNHLNKLRMSLGSISDSTNMHSSRYSVGSPRATQRDKVMAGLNNLSASLDLPSAGVDGDLAARLNRLKGMGVNK